MRSAVVEGVWVAVGLLALASTAFAADCAEMVGPGKFKVQLATPHSLALPGNAGIAPTGFVALGPSTPVQHGIDVSKYQDSANFLKAKACGATFAYVRLSGGVDPNNELTYRTQWAAARAANLLVGPYHNLSVLPESVKGLRRMDSPVLRQRIEDLMPIAEKVAKMQARLFVNRLDEVLSLDPIPDKVTHRSHPSYLPVALDASIDPISGANSEQKKLFGRLYGRMICTWIEELKAKKRPDIRLVLHTSASIYHDYQLASAPCGLQDYKVWIRIRPMDGGGIGEYEATVGSDAFSYTCGPHKFSERCILEQYTSFGGFAAYSAGAPLDLDRFYGTKKDLKALLQE